MIETNISFFLSNTPPFQKNNLNLAALVFVSLLNPSSAFIYT